MDVVALIELFEAKRNTMDAASRGKLLAVLDGRRLGRVAALREASRTTRTDVAEVITKVSEASYGRGLATAQLREVVARSVL